MLTTEPPVSNSSGSNNDDDDDDGYDDNDYDTPSNMRKTPIDTVGVPETYNVKNPVMI